MLQGTNLFYCHLVCGASPLCLGGHSRCTSPETRRTLSGLANMGPTTTQISQPGARRTDKLSFSSSQIQKSIQVHCVFVVEFSCPFDMGH